MSKAWDCGRSLDCGFEYHRGYVYLSLLSVACTQVSGSARSLVQRSRTKRDASEYNPETSTMKKPGPIRAVGTIKKASWYFIKEFVGH